MLSAPAGAIATGQSALVEPERPAPPRGDRRRARRAARPPRAALRAGAATATPGRPDTPQPTGRGPVSRQAGRRSGGRREPLSARLDGLDRPPPPGDARRRPSPEARWTCDQSRWRRPSPFDPALQALLAARAKKLPVWWEATPATRSTGRSTSPRSSAPRAVIVGGREAAKVVDRLKAEARPRRAPAQLPRGAQGPDRGGIPQEGRRRARRAARVLAQRKDKWKEQVGTAAALAKAGVPFAFATEGIDRIETVPGAAPRQLITAGLTADDALAGLTTKRRRASPGVERRLGTLEPGKLGHVIVMTARSRREGQGPVRPDRRPEIRDQARAGRRGRPCRRTPRRGRRGRGALAAAARPGPGKVRNGSGTIAPACPPGQGQRPTPEANKDEAGQPTKRGLPGTAEAKPKAASSTPPSAEAQAQPSRPGPRPRQPDCQAGQARGQKRRPTRSSTSPPSSTTTASRRSTPAATC